MKKILSFILSAVIILSAMTAAISVGASDTVAPTSQEFNSTDSFVSDSEAVSIEGNSALKISYPDGMENASNTWNIIGMSANHVDKAKDATISFRFMVDGTQVGGTWWYGLSIAFSINTWNAPSKDAINLIAPADSSIVGTAQKVVAKRWYRVDVLADRDGNGNAAGTYEVYLNGEKVYTLDRQDTKYSHINAMYVRPTSCGTARKAVDYYFDDFCVREGLYAPTGNDAYSSGDSTAIKALPGFKGYSDLSSMPTMYASNSNCSIALCAYDTYLSVKSEAGADAVSAYVPLAVPSGNATVDFKLRAEFSDSVNSGASFCLADGANAGITVLGNGKISPSGTDVCLKTLDLEKEAALTSGKWHSIRIVVNSAKGKLTLYIDGTEYIWFAYNTSAELNGLYISTLGGGASQVTYSVDSLSVKSGMYAPSADRELDSRNIRVIGHQEIEWSDSEGKAKKDLRFVCTVDKLEEYSKIGINVQASGKKATDFDIDTVYTSVLGNDNGKEITYTAEAWGYNYIFVVECGGMPADAEITFVVTPYAYANGVRTEFAPMTIALNGGNAQ